MLLLLKECLKYGRYNNKSNHGKNVELLMAYKKTCGNMIKVCILPFKKKQYPAVILNSILFFKLVCHKECSTCVDSGNKFGFGHFSASVFGIQLRCFFDVSRL